MQQRFRAISAALILLAWGWASAQDFAGTYQEEVYGIIITIERDGDWVGRMESGGATFPLTLVYMENELIGSWEIDDELVGFSATLTDSGDLNFSLYEFISWGEPDPDTFEYYSAKRLTPAPQRSSLGGALAGSATSPPATSEAPAATPQLPLADLLVIDGVWQSEDDLFQVGVPALITYTFASGQFELTLGLLGEQLAWYRGVYQLQAEPGATSGLLSLQIVDYSPEMCFQGECEPVYLTDEERFAISEVTLTSANTLRITEEDGTLNFTRAGNAPAAPSVPSVPSVPSAPSQPAAPPAPSTPPAPSAPSGAGSPPPPSAPPAPKVP